MVIPIKDERDNLRPLHERLTRALDPLGIDYEVLFIDDGSSDRSYEVLEHCSNEVCATRTGLKLASLIEQVFNISAKRFAKIEVEFDCLLLPAANQPAFGSAEQPYMETVLSEDSVGDCRYAINAAEQLNGFVFFAGEQILSSHGGGVATVVTQTSAKKHA